MHQVIQAGTCPRLKASTCPPPTRLPFNRGGGGGRTREPFWGGWIELFFWRGWGAGVVAAVSVVVGVVGVGVVVVVVVVGVSWGSSRGGRFANG